MQRTWSCKENMLFIMLMKCNFSLQTYTKHMYQPFATSDGFFNTFLTRIKKTNLSFLTVSTWSCCKHNHNVERSSRSLPACPSTLTITTSLNKNVTSLYYKDLNCVSWCHGGGHSWYMGWQQRVLEHWKIQYQLIRDSKLGSTQQLVFPSWTARQRYSSWAPREAED